MQYDGEMSFKTHKEMDSWDVCWKCDFILLVKVASMLARHCKSHLGNDHLTWREGYVFFLKKYSDSQCCWKKYSDFGGGKNK